MSGATPDLWLQILTDLENVRGRFGCIPLRPALLAVGSTTEAIESYLSVAEN